MFAPGVVHSYHRESQYAIALHGLESDDACCRLLTSAHDFITQIRSLVMYHLNKITAVIDYDVRSVFQTHLYMTHVFLICSPVVCEDFQSAVSKCCSYIVLCRKAVASRH